MVASAEFDPVVVDAKFSLDRLVELLAFARESAKLDYKISYDPSLTSDRVEVVKDMVAMANTAGGYIVIGVTDDGNATGADHANLSRTDEAVVRAQVRAYIGTAIDLFVNAPVDHDGKQFGVLTVLKSAKSPIVFETVGQYQSKGGKSKVLFSPGDVFVRHGSASERWNQNDVETIYARVIEREKEKWLRDALPDFKRLIEAVVQGQAPPDPREIVAQDAAAFDKIARVVAKSLIP